MSSNVEWDKEWSYHDCGTVKTINGKAPDEDGDVECPVSGLYSLKATSNSDGKVTVKVAVEP